MKKTPATTLDKEKTLLGEKTVDRQSEAAERVEMRHWLRKQGVDPVMGSNREATERLMEQVFYAGGNPHNLMRNARADVDARREAAITGKGARC